MSSAIPRLSHVSSYLSKMYNTHLATSPVPAPQRTMGFWIHLDEYPELNRRHELDHPEAVILTRAYGTSMGGELRVEERGPMFDTVDLSLRGAAVVDRGMADAHGHYHLYTPLRNISNTGPIFVRVLGRDEEDVAPLEDPTLLSYPMVENYLTVCANQIVGSELTCTRKVGGVYVDTRNKWHEDHYVSVCASTFAALLLDDPRQMVLEFDQEEITTSTNISIELPPWARIWRELLLAHASKNALLFSLVLFGRTALDLLHAIPTDLRTA